MPIRVDAEVRDYFREHSEVWQTRVERSPSLDAQAATYASAVRALEELDAEEANELLAVSLGYISDANNRIAIYQQALEMLRSGEPEDAVDTWLLEMGYPVEHNKLGPQLVQKISNVFRAIIQVVQNFIKHVVNVLTMKLDSVSFHFSISPAVNLTFK